MSYPCKYDHLCKTSGHFNPAKTIPVIIKDINGQPKILQKSNKCTHGGGCGCLRWRRHTDRELGWNRPFSNRSQDPKVLKYTIEVPPK